MHANAKLIERFYKAFSVRDSDTMATCYHERVHFSDGAFVDLDHRHVTGMWRMLCTRGKDLTLTYSDIRADDERGSARWIADYTFSTTGRKVNNIIDASFRFADGLIIDHQDRFDFHRWSRQALGPTGLLLGWTSFLQKKVQRTARKNLDTFLATQPLG